MLSPYMHFRENGNSIHHAKLGTLALVRSAGKMQRLLLEIEDGTIGAQFSQ